MQIPALIKAANQRMLNMIVMKFPGAMDDGAVFVALILRQVRSFSSAMRGYRHDVRRAIREPDARPGERDLHHVLREIARRMHHVLVCCGNAATGRVVVGAEVRCYATATCGL